MGQTGLYLAQWRNRPYPIFTMSITDLSSATPISSLKYDNYNTFRVLAVGKYQVKFDAVYI